MTPIALAWLLVFVFSAVGILLWIVARPMAKVAVWWQSRGPAFQISNGCRHSCTTKKHRSSLSGWSALPSSFWHCWGSPGRRPALRAVACEVVPDGVGDQMD